MNSFFETHGYPANSAEGKSVDLRAELLALQAAFDKMPVLAGNGDKLVIVNAAGTGLTVNPIGIYQANGSWTPVLTCATPGNLNVVYSSQLGSISKIGQLFKLSWLIQTSTFTHTTASGAIQITGAPTINGGPFNRPGVCAFGGMTKAGYTQVTAEYTGSMVLLRGSGSAQPNAQLGITDFPTAGTVYLFGEVWYESAS